MLRFRYVLILTTILIGIWGILPSKADAFPLRFDEDCFYGEGEPTSGDWNSWMGYAVTFEPPYLPYTVDGISIFISDMQLSEDASRNLRISVLDDSGILRQFTSINWREMEGHEGWVLIDLANREYTDRFTVIVHSGVGLNPSVSNVPIEAVFSLGIDGSDPVCHSLMYTDNSSPPLPPTGPLADGELIAQSSAAKAKLVPAPTALPTFPGGNWMIRAHAPGLQTESRSIVITMDDIAALYTPPPIPTPLDWHLPPLSGEGPRGTVHCPTSLAGVTLYYYEDNRNGKFLIPHDGPWIHPDLVNALGALCVDLASEGVVGIEHIGIFNDRNIRGTNTRSSHAYGLGIDLCGFQFSDGRVYMVEDHDNPEVRQWLEHVRDDYLGRYFPTVIDWHYQRHDNHFHVNLPYPH